LLKATSAAISFNAKGMREDIVKEMKVLNLIWKEVHVSDISTC
jgi:hypothetical protein